MKHEQFAKLFETEEFGQIVLMKAQNDEATCNEDAMAITITFSYCNGRATLTIKAMSKETCNKKFDKMDQAFVCDFIKSALIF